MNGTMSSPATAPAARWIWQYHVETVTINTVFGYAVHPAAQLANQLAAQGWEWFGTVPISGRGRTQELQLSFRRPVALP